MTRAHKFLVTLLMLSAQLLIVDSAEAREWFFRGIPLEQTDATGVTNRFSSQLLGGREFYTDVVDLFSQLGRDGELVGSRADARVLGLVAPLNGVPNGPLTGDAADRAGRWMGHSDYVVSNGQVRRATGEGIAVTHLPWRVTERLGDDYLLEMSAVVAAGETARLGYLGDVITVGTGSGLAGELGELVLGVERIDGTQLKWSVAWNMDNGSRQEFSSFLNTPHDSTGEEIKLQLGWQDIFDSGDDLLDAWLETSAGNTQLLSGNMSTEIAVHSVGIELTGVHSYATGFLAAVPEPGTCFLSLIGLIGMLVLRRGNKKQA